jgi:hypothetical protein
MEVRGLVSRRWRDGPSLGAPDDTGAWDRGGLWDREAEVGEGGGGDGVGAAAGW